MFKTLKAICRAVIEFNALFDKNPKVFGPNIVIEELKGREHRITFLNIHTREVETYENGQPMSIGTEHPMCPYCGERLSHVHRCTSCNRLVETRKVYTTVGDDPYWMEAKEAPAEKPRALRPCDQYGGRE